MDERRVRIVLDDVRQRMAQIRAELRTARADESLLMICCLDARLVELESIEIALTVAAA